MLNDPLPAAAFFFGGKVYQLFHGLVCIRLFHMHYSILFNVHWSYYCEAPVYPGAEKEQSDYLPDVCRGHFVLTGFFPGTIDIMHRRNHDSYLYFSEYGKPHNSQSGTL